MTYGPIFNSSSHVLDSFFRTRHVNTSVVPLVEQAIMCSTCITYSLTANVLNEVLLSGNMVILVVVAFWKCVIPTYLPRVRAQVLLVHSSTWANERPTSHPRYPRGSLMDFKMPEKGSLVRQEPMYKTFLSMVGYKCL